MLDNQNPSLEAVELAAGVVQRGGIIVYPTDTVYGLGANALRAECVERLFKIKKRPSSKPVPVMIKDIAMAQEIAFLNSRKEKILEAVWPGPITVVVEKRNVLPDNLTAGQKTIGLRIPNHLFTRLLMEKINFPLTTTSANLSGEKPMTDSTELIYLFKKNFPRPDLILDCGQLPDSLPSTVLDITGKQVKILRVGLTSKDVLLKLLEL